MVCCTTVRCGTVWYGAVPRHATKNKLNKAFRRQLATCRVRRSKEGWRIEDGDREREHNTGKAQSELVFANERYFVICLNRDLFATQNTNRDSETASETQMEIERRGWLIKI